VMWIPAMVCLKRERDHSAFNGSLRLEMAIQSPQKLQGKTKIRFNLYQKGSSSLSPWPAKGPVR
jgi:hypothetical protein